jgi:hypothetical protein
MLAYLKAFSLIVPTHALLPLSTPKTNKKAAS